MPTHFPHNAERGGGVDPAPIVQQRNIIQHVTAMVGSAFLIVGIAGAVRVDIARSGYDVSVTGSVVQVVLGGGGWLLSGNCCLARAYLVVGGLVYLVLSLSHRVGEHVATQAGLSAVMIACGMWLGRRPSGDASNG